MKVERFMSLYINIGDGGDETNGTNIVPSKSCSDRKHGRSCRVPAPSRPMEMFCLQTTIGKAVAPENPIPNRPKSDLRHLILSLRNRCLNRHPGWKILLAVVDGDSFLDAVSNLKTCEGFRTKRPLIWVMIGDFDLVTCVF